MIGLLLSGCTWFATAPQPATLAASELSPMWQASNIQVYEQTWTFGNDTGRAWWVQLPRSSSLNVVPSPTVAALADLTSSIEPPYASINGGFYESGPMGLVVSGGTKSSPLTSRGGSGVLVYEPHLGARIIHRNEWDDVPPEALQSIDRLVDEGISLVKIRPGARKAVRSAVALSPEHIWLVVAAGTESVEETSPAEFYLTNTVAHGLPLWAFAELLVETGGPTEALNLDGAISSGLRVVTDTRTLEVKDAVGTINAVVVRPQDAKAAASTSQAVGADAEQGEGRSEEAPRPGPGQ